MAKSFGAHHEWDRLREVVIGLSPAEDFIVFHEESMRWQTPEAAEFSRSHAGEPLLGVDPEWAARMERQLDALAERVAREGVTVHRPERLQGAERTFLAPNGAGTQLFARDPMIVVGDHAIEGSLRIQCRQRERFGLRAHLQKAAIERGARWTSVPLGWLNGVDGPFLEGGDTLLNGREVYVGMSGCASDMAGVDWLQALLGDQYRVIPVALRSDVLHLDNALALIRPGLLVWCPDRLIDGLPMSLRDWEAITVSKAESVRLATNILVLDEGCVIADSDNARVIGELRQQRLDVIPLPFDGPIRLGGGLRSAHHPLWREGILE
jgi:N-dimethylarginine dimethylaminohydrolase